MDIIKLKIICNILNKSSYKINKNNMLIKLSKPEDIHDIISKLEFLNIKTKKLKISWKNAPRYIKNNQDIKYKLIKSLQVISKPSFNDCLIMACKLSLHIHKYNKSPGFNNFTKNKNKIRNYILNVLGISYLALIDIEKIIKLIDI